MLRMPAVCLSATTTRLIRAIVLVTVVLMYSIANPLARLAHADVLVGGSAGNFLTFEVGGRSAGMAGAQTGVANGVTAQFWNPAALATLNQSQVGAMHANWLGGLSYEWLGIARPMGKLGVGSLSVAYFHAPGIQGADEFGNPTGEFKVYDVALTAGLSRSITSALSIGANAKMIRQSLGTVSATAPAVDVGLRGVLAGATFGAAVQNLGPKLSFDGSGYPLPRQIKFGAGRGFFDDRVQIAADYNIPLDYYKDIRIGTEVRALPNVSLRLGYRHEMGTTGDPATGLSYGLGLHFRQLELDYALTPSDQFDNVHRLSFGYSFGSGSEEKSPAKPKAPKPAPPEPTTPRVIASTPPAKAPAVSAPTAAPSPVAPAPTVAPAAPAPEVAETVVPKPVKSKPAEFVVILPGYFTEQSAQAELKALEMLGFRTKDAIIEKAPKSGYQVRLARLRNKNNADDMAASLARMSFRALVVVVER